MDHIAQALGRDPLEVRRANFYRAAEERPGVSPPDPQGISAKKKPGAVLPDTVDLTSRGGERPCGGSAAGPRCRRACRPRITTCGRRLHRARARGGAGSVVGLSRAARGDRRVEPGKPGPQARDRADPGEVRHLLHPDLAEPGRRAGACLPGRLGADEPWRDRDGTGPVPEGGAGGRGRLRAGGGGGEDHCHRHGPGAQHLGHRRVVGRGPERGWPCARPAKRSGRGWRSFWPNATRRKPGMCASRRVACGWPGRTMPLPRSRPWPIRRASRFPRPVSTARPRSSGTA